MDEIKVFSTAYNPISTYSELVLSTSSPLPTEYVEASYNSWRNLKEKARIADRLLNGPISKQFR